MTASPMAKLLLLKASEIAIAIGAPGEPYEGGDSIAEDLATRRPIRADQQMPRPVTDADYYRLRLAEQKRARQLERQSKGIKP